MGVILYKQMLTAFTIILKWIGVCAKPLIANIKKELFRFLPVIKKQSFTFQLINLLR